MIGRPRLAGCARKNRGLAPTRSRLQRKPAIRSFVREPRAAVDAVWASSARWMVERLRRVPLRVWYGVGLPLCLVVGAWIAWEQTPWARQGAVIARLEAHGALIVLYPGELPSGLRVVERPLNALPYGPFVDFREWTAFQDVTGIRVEGPGSAAALRDLGACRQLQTFSANGTDVDDDTLRSIAQCSRLRYVHLADTAVTDRSLDGLSRLPDLMRLDLSGTDVTEKGIRRLTGCSNLHTIHLDGTRVSDDAVAALAALPNLQNLSLARTRVTDASLQALLKTKSLRSLWLTKSQVTTDGLVKFWRLRPDVDLDFDRWRPPGQM
jgi:hypothetical protein